LRRLRWNREAIAGANGWADLCGVVGFLCVHYFPVVEGGKRMKNTQFYTIMSGIFSASCFVETNIYWVPAGLALIYFVLFCTYAFIELKKKP
jgi:hypothetical protein